MDFYFHRLKVTGLLLLSLLLCAAAYYCTTSPELFTKFVGWLGIVFFGLLPLPRWMDLLHKGPVVTIGADGIRDRRLGVYIPWQQVTRIWTTEVRRHRFLCLEVRDLSRCSWEEVTLYGRLQRLTRSLNRGLGGGAINISFMELKPGLTEAWQFVQARGLARTST